MSFRDDGDAARARADALSRELDEKDAEIEALRAQLEKKDEALREAKEDASPILEAAERAQRALDALKRRRAETAKRAREEAREAPNGEDERERERRRISSASAWGDLDWGSLTVIALVPTVIATVVLATTYWWSVYVLVVPACAGILLLALHRAAHGLAERRWSLEERWARSRPYRLLGYLESLEKRPRSTTSMPIFRLDDDRHQVLELELHFAGGIPADLSEIMSGFDELLSTSSPLKYSPLERFERRARGEPDVAETKPNVFYRASPVTTTRPGSSSTIDHNRAVRDWMHRLDREVLEPLHARHALTRVELHLR